MAVKQVPSKVKHSSNTPAKPTGKPGKSTGKQSKSTGKTEPSSGTAEQPTSKSAKILYRPVGIVSSMVGGIAANIIFKQVWKRAAPGEHPDPPGALETGYSLRQILLAAAIQGMTYSLVKTIISRGGARLFERWSGEWPGS